VSRQKPDETGAIYFEGVPYRRYVVTFRLADGRRRRWVRWSPGFPWVFSEVARELQDRFEPEDIAPKSVEIFAA
jgi:hypothetical protein